MQNLEFNTPIVNPDGTPTDYFMRILQGRGGILQSTEEQLADLLLKQIIAGIGLDGGGTLGNPGNITLDANVQDILDLISTTQGSILYRGAADWAALAPGTSGHFLKTLGAGADPAWAAASGGGGGTWTVVEDFTIPGATATHNVDVSAYDEIMTVFIDVTSSAVASRGLRFSIDGGVTYKSTSGDYKIIPSNGVTVNNTQVTLHSSSNAGARSCVGITYALRQSTAQKITMGSDTVDGVATYFNFTGAITHVQYLGHLGNLTGGRLLTLGK